MENQQAYNVENWSPLELKLVICTVLQHMYYRRYTWNWNQKRPGVALPIKTKFDVIQALLEPGATQLSLADKFGVARSSVGKILRDKDEIRDLFYNDQKLSLRKGRLAI